MITSQIGTKNSQFFILKQTNLASRLNCRYIDLIKIEFVKDSVSVQNKNSSLTCDIVLLYLRNFRCLILV